MGPLELLHFKKEWERKNYLFVDKHIDHAFEEKLGENANKAERVMAFYYHWHRKLNMFGFPVFRVENFFSDNQTAVDTLQWIIVESNLTDRIKHYDKQPELLRGEMTDALYKSLHTKVNS